MKVVKLVIFLLIAYIPSAIGAITPAQILEKTSGSISKAKGISSVFVIKNQGKSYKGNFKAKGNKFSFISSFSSIWYDGKNMWVYNPMSKETTLTCPDKAEVAETNPLSYISGYRKYYVASFSNRKVKGQYVVKLTPKKSSSGMPPVEISINQSTYKPVEFRISPKGMGITTVSFSSLNYNANISDTELKYPEKSYKNVEVVDMR
ncbi:MAG: outer membrane lipoprotein carrier protein LolA [Roseburia sp.]|nr:outer membrane lipoprotein carrier protein LolA [Roseburia sp.]